MEAIGLVLESLISPAIGFGKDAVVFLWRKLQRPDPAELIAKRQRLKAEVEGHMEWIDASGRYGEVIIRDLRRADEYPLIDDKPKGISSWFKVTLLGTYQRGIQTGLRFCSLKRCAHEDGWYMTSDHNRAQLNAILVGRIPYDRIETIDWTGDEYYDSPHLYCRFVGWRPSPYEALVFCEEHFMNHPQPGSWYKEVAPYETARKLTMRYEPTYFA